MDLTRRCLSATVLGLFILVTVVGCAQRADDPHRSWWLQYSAEDEKEIGKEASQELEEQVGVYEAEQLTSYVNSVGQRVALHSDRGTIDYHFRVLESFQVNAVALPGGYVYVTRGLLNEIDNEAQLAAVLGHEVAHVDAYHALKRRQGQIIGMLASAALAPATGGASLAAGMMGTSAAARGYTRTAEEQADDLGMTYAARANYDPEGMVSFLQRLQELTDEIPDRELIMLRTHPFLQDRIRNTRSMLPAKRRIMTEESIHNAARFRRHIRAGLFRPEEEQVREQLAGMIEAFEQLDVEGFMEHLSEDFEGPGDDEPRTKEEYREYLEEDLSGLDRIDYSYKLMDLREEEETILMVYEFEMTRHSEDGGTETRSGYQELRWEEVDGRWKLKSLR